MRATGLLKVLRKVIAIIGPQDPQPATDPSVARGTEHKDVICLKCRRGLGWTWIIDRLLGAMVIQKF